MVRETLDAFLGTSFFHKIAYLSFYNVAREGGYIDGDNEYPPDNKDDGEDTPIIAQRVDFPIPHSGKGRHGHIEGIKKVPSLDGFVSNSPGKDDEDQKEETETKPPRGYGPQLSYSFTPNFLRISGVRAFFLVIWANILPESLMVLFCVLKST